jgi:hypothetical protein
MKYPKSALYLATLPAVAYCNMRVRTGKQFTGTELDKARFFAEEIAGPGVTVIDAMYDHCDDDHIGLFNNAQLELGMDFNDGIVLSSGFVSDVLGPNNNKYTGDTVDRKGDNDLNLLLDQEGRGEATKDACVLHITFNCADKDHFALQFVFGSDSYQCPIHDPSTNFNNDVMGIFAGKRDMGMARNIGLVNGNYVSVNTVYKGTYPEGFVDNCKAAKDTEMNGFTRPVKINNKKQLIKDGKNELWIAVADGYIPGAAADDKKASWLFIKRASLVCIEPGANPPPPLPQATTPPLRTGINACANHALNSCGGLPGGCGRVYCLRKYIQNSCYHPGSGTRIYHTTVRKRINHLCTK